MRNADLIIEFLVANGIDRIFSLSGNQIMPIYDACIGRPIQIIHVRHESAAVFMAEAYAQITGQVGVALVTAGPGFTNSLGAVFSAKMSETPILLLSGDSQVSQDGTGAFQELDQVTMSRPVTKRSIRCTKPENLLDSLQTALSTALEERRGPAHLALPQDISTANWRGVTDVDLRYVGEIDPGLSDNDVQTITDQLVEASHPLILTGPAGADSRSGTANHRLKMAFGLPVIAAESPRGLKDPALGEFAGLLERADLVVCLTKRVDYVLGFGHLKETRGQKWIVIDPDREVLELAQHNLGKQLIGSYQAALEPARTQLADSLAKRQRCSSVWTQEVSRALAARATLENGADAMTSDAVCRVIQRIVGQFATAIFIADGGEFGQWAQATITAPRRLINGLSGAIGGCLCYGLATKLARPEATCFVLMGDGTAGFHFMEFETAVRENIPFVCVIGNDGKWNAEHQIQLRDYGPDRLIGCDIGRYRYDAMVAAIGGHGEHVTILSELEPALYRAIESGLPACVNVEIEGIPAPVL